MHFWSDNPEQRPSLDGRMVLGILLAVLVLIAAAKPMLRARDGGLDAARPTGGLPKTAAKPVNGVPQGVAANALRPYSSAEMGE
jgi:hypothetical protein